MKYLLFVILLCLIGCNKPKSENDFSRYQVGDVWSYDTREGENRSSICIRKIDTLKNDSLVFYLTIHDVEMSGYKTDSIILRDIPYDVFSYRALSKSLKSKMDSNHVCEIKEFEEAYPYLKEEKRNPYDSTIVSYVDIIQLHYKITPY